GAAATAIRRSARAPALVAPVVVAAAAIAAAAVYAPTARDYLRDRFRSAPSGTELTGAWGWAQKTTDSGIALGGTTAAFHQYPFYGPDLSNRVTYLANTDPHGARSPIVDCRRWREAIDSGRYDIVVTAPGFD